MLPPPRSGAGGAQEVRPPIREQLGLGRNEITSFPFMCTIFPNNQQAVKNINPYELVWIYAVK